jgi:hypothetical protein
MELLSEQALELIAGSMTYSYSWKGSNGATATESCTNVLQQAEASNGSIAYCPDGPSGPAYLFHGTSPYNDDQWVPFDF